MEYRSWYTFMEYKSQYILRKIDAGINGIQKLVYIVKHRFYGIQKMVYNMEYRSWQTLWNIEVGIHYGILKLVYIMEYRSWYTSWEYRSWYTL